MTDLNLGPAPTRSRWPAIAVAAGVLCAIGVALYVLTPYKAAALKVTRADVFAPSTEFKQTGKGMHVIGTGSSTENNVYIVATLQLANTERVPVYPSTIAARMLDTTDAYMDATVISPRDFPRLEQSFPELQPLLVAPLTDGEEIAPGTTREGTVLLLFPGIAKDVWQAKKSATLTLTLRHHTVPAVANIP